MSLPEEYEGFTGTCGTCGQEDNREKLLQIHSLVQSALSFQSSEEVVSFLEKINELSYTEAMNDTSTTGK